LKRAEGLTQPTHREEQLKLRIALACAALVAFALPFVASAGSPTDRATGGGQVLIGTRGGAGDTIAFTAQDRTTNPGQVQYVDRTATGQTVLHGTVSCLAVSDNMAKIGGEWGAGGTFQIIVIDNGEGIAADDDVVTIQDGQDPTCDQEDDDDDDPIALARGNAQVYDAP
jgi:hypothetical protein